MSFNNKIQLPFLQKESTKHNKKINIGKRKVRFNGPTYQFPIQKPSEYDDFLDQIPEKDNDIRNYLIATQYFGNEVQNGLDNIITNEGKLSSAAFRLASDLPSTGILKNKAAQSYFFDNRRKFEGKNPILMRQNIFSNVRVDDNIPKLPNIPGRFDVGDDPRKYRDMDIEERLKNLRNRSGVDNLPDNDDGDEIQRRLDNLRNPVDLPLPRSDNNQDTSLDRNDTIDSVDGERQNRGINFIENSNRLAKEIDEGNDIITKEKQAKRIYTQLPPTHNTIEDVTTGKTE